MSTSRTLALAVLLALSGAVTFASAAKRCLPPVFEEGQNYLRTLTGQRFALIEIDQGSCSVLVDDLGDDDPPMWVESGKIIGWQRVD